MLTLTQTTGYAMRALSCLESSTGAWVMAKDIAGCTGIPLPYLSKLLNALAGSGLIQAKRGYRGGFRLASAPADITLVQVADAVDGPQWYLRCLLGLAECSDERACPTHAFWVVQRQRIRAELSRLTLCDVADFERQQGRGLGCCEAKTKT